VGSLKFVGIHDRGRATGDARTKLTQEATPRKDIAVLDGKAIEDAKEHFGKVLQQQLER